MCCAQASADIVRVHVDLCGPQETAHPGYLAGVGKAEGNETVQNNGLLKINIASISITH
jgi:hypothetical protein